MESLKVICKPTWADHDPYTLNEGWAPYAARQLEAGGVVGSFMSANAFFLIDGGLIFLLLALRLRVEEANLLNRFGEDYRNYMDRTGRFFPRF